MDIKKELDEHQTMLLIIPSTEYNDLLLNIARQLNDKKLCYVTLNKTAGALIELFKKNNVNNDNIIFIDTITKTIKSNPEPIKGCHFIASPGAFTEISLKVSEILKQGVDYLIFDSLTNLLVYEKKAPIAKFVSNLINKIKQTNTKAAFYTLNLQEQEVLIQESGMFVDKVLDLSD